VQSEHCVGYLKGRWGSLKGLRVSIKGEKGVQYATLWIIACIHLHAFAMRHEQGEGLTRDRFYRNGRRYQKKQQRLEREWKRDHRRNMDRAETILNEDEDIGLLRGKIKREELKEALFNYIHVD